MNHLLPSGFCRTLRLVTAAAAALAPPAAFANVTVTLGFGSLPSTQGWKYFSDGPSETEVFSVDGSKLVQNTLGTGFTYASYVRPVPLDPSLPFVMQVRARVIESEGQETPPNAFMAYVYMSNLLYGVGLNATSAGLPAGSGSIIALDTTQFHTYRIEAKPGVSVKIFVDGTLLIDEAPPVVVSPDNLSIGNNTSYEKGHAELTEFYLRQPIPEPSSQALMLLGLLGVAAGVGRVRSRAESVRG